MSISLPDLLNDASPLGIVGSLYLRNFKCFGPSGQTIPLSKINLLFGPNSSGKSSVFQAIHLVFHSYLGRHLVKGTVDLERSQYSRIVNKGRTDEPIVIGLTLRHPAAVRGSNEFPTIYFRFRQGRNDTIELDTMEFAVGLGCRITVRKEEVEENCYLRIVDFQANPGELQSFLQQQVNEFASKITDTDVFEIKQAIVSTRVVRNAYGVDPISISAASIHPVVSELVSSLISTGLENGCQFLGHYQNNMAHVHPIRQIPSLEGFAKITSTSTDFVVSIENSVWARLIGRPDFLREVNLWLGRGALNLGYELLATDRVVGTSLDGTPSRILVIRDTENPMMETVEMDFDAVGVGVSQVIPVIGACCTHNEVLMFIEQPELHLHPRAQCELGDVFVAKSKDRAAFVEGNFNARNVFVVETHSEHLVLRLLRRIRETTAGLLDESPYLQIAPDDVSVNYFEMTPFGVTVHNLPITPDGDFVGRWPDGFFPERATELFD